MSTPLVFEVEVEGRTGAVEVAAPHTGAATALSPQVVFAAVPTPGPQGLPGVLTGIVDDYLDFTTITTPATPTAGTARMFAGTAQNLDAVGYLNTLGVPIVMGRDVLFYAKNGSGSTLTKGTAVYVSGAAGANPLIDKARADPSPTNLPAVGLVAADIVNNASGMVMIRGVLHMNTSAFTDGDLLYLSPTTPGLLTNTNPSHPDVTQTLAVVQNAGIGNGAVLVSVVPINPHEYEGVNGVSWAVGDATGTTKSYLVKHAAGTGTLAWNPTANRTITLPDATGIPVFGSAAGTPTALTLWTGTAAQYAAVSPKNANTIYVVTA